MSDKPFECREPCECESLSECPYAPLRPQRVATAALIVAVSLSMCVLIVAACAAAQFLGR